MVFSDRNARLGAPILIFSPQNPRANSSETLLRTQLAGQTVLVNPILREKLKKMVQNSEKDEK